MQELINDEFTNSGRGDIHQTHFKYINYTSHEYEVESKVDSANVFMSIQPKKEIFYHRLEEINLEKLLNIGFLFLVFHILMIT